MAEGKPLAAPKTPRPIRGLSLAGRAASDRHQIPTERWPAQEYAKDQQAFLESREASSPVRSTLVSAYAGRASVDDGPAFRLVSASVLADSHRPFVLHDGLPIICCEGSSDASSPRVAGLNLEAANEFISAAPHEANGRITDPGCDSAQRTVE
jgi:hypothetical protein